jgi:hypothetical protein
MCKANTTTKQNAQGHKCFLPTSSQHTGKAHRPLTVRVGVAKRAPSVKQPGYDARELVILSCPELIPSVAWSCGSRYPATVDVMPYLRLKTDVITRGKVRIKQILMSCQRKWHAQTHTHTHTHTHTPHTFIHTSRPCRALYYNITFLFDVNYFGTMQAFVIVRVPVLLYIARVEMRVCITSFRRRNTPAMTHTNKESKPPEVWTRVTGS